MKNAMLFRALTLDGRIYGELFNSCEDANSSLSNRLTNPANSIDYKAVKVNGRLPKSWINGHCPPLLYTLAHLEFIKFVQRAQLAAFTYDYCTSHRYGVTYTYNDGSKVLVRNNGSVLVRIPNGTTKGFTIDTNL